jgi:hypothetical protein
MPVANNCSLEHREFKRSIENSSAGPQVWRRRSEGSATSHNGFSENFLGDGTCFWRDGKLVEAEIQD